MEGSGPGEVLVLILTRPIVGEGGESSMGIGRTLPDAISSVRRTASLSQSCSTSAAERSSRLARSSRARLARAEGPSCSASTELVDGHGSSRLTRSAATAIVLCRAMALCPAGDSDGGQTRGRLDPEWVAGLARNIQPPPAKCRLDLAVRA